MPYITRSQRNLVNGSLSTLVDLVQNGGLVAGDLNYIFTIVVNEYLKKEGLNYQNINNALGALEGAKLELYRRVAGNYENSKVISNGDVYDKCLTGDPLQKRVNDNTYLEYYQTGPCGAD